MDINDFRVGQIWAHNDPQDDRERLIVHIATSIITYRSIKNNIFPSNLGKEFNCNMLHFNEFHLIGASLITSQQPCDELQIAPKQQLTEKQRMAKFFFGKTI